MPVCKIVVLKNGREINANQSKLLNSVERSRNGPRVVCSLFFHINFPSPLSCPVFLQLQLSSSSPSTSSESKLTTATVNDIGGAWWWWWLYLHIRGDFFNSQEFTQFFSFPIHRASPWICRFCWYIHPLSQCFQILLLINKPFSGLYTVMAEKPDPCPFSSFSYSKLRHFFPLSLFEAPPVTTFLGIQGFGFCVVHPKSNLCSNQHAFQEDSS